MKIILIFLLMTSSLLSGQNKINSELNEKYKSSRKDFYGRLNENESKEMRALLKKELGITIPDDKSILINFHQTAPNCFNAKLNRKDFTRVMKNRIQLSGKMARDYNATSHFIYTSNCFNNEIYSENKFFKLDSGFFYEKIFTLHENCNAFYILKPNGEFMIHYGSDYYSDVKAFLEKQ